MGEDKGEEESTVSVVECGAEMMLLELVVSEVLVEVLTEVSLGPKQF